MKDPTHDEWHRLFHNALNGTINDAEKVQLATLLKNDAAARQLWFLYTDNECSLAELKVRDRGRLSPSHPEPAESGWRSTLRPLTAAAAGVIFGVFCASAAWAYVSPGLPKMMSHILAVTNAGFEASPVPIAHGVPVEYGIWSGDFTEIVGPEQGIAPQEGKGMLRFLRSDSTVAAQPKRTSKNDTRIFNGNLYQIVDARPWRAVIASGTAVVDWSAWFNCTPEEPEARTQFMANVWAFSGDTAILPYNWSEGLYREIAHSSWRVTPDEDPQTWQRVAGSMIVPPDADFFVVELKVVGTPRTDSEAIVFPGHYADNVRMVLRSATGKSSTHPR